MDTEATADDSMRRPIGAILGAARVASALELTDVARDTRVPVRHLAAIEADDHDHLPALPYAIGFVKAFARVVGVDPEMAGAHFRAETSKAAHVPLPPTMTPLDERRLPPRGVVAASLAALVVVVALVVAWSAGAFDPSPPAAPLAAATPSPVTVVPAGATASTPPAPGATIGSTTPTPAASATPTPATASGAPTPIAAPSVPTAMPVATGAGAVPAPAGTGPASGVVITASEDAWFKVSVYDAAAGKVVTVKTGVLAKGERYVPPARPGLRLWTGRAGALAITVDGRPIPPLGGPVETVKNVSLDASDLRARLAAAPVTGVPAAR